MALASNSPERLEIFKLALNKLHITVCKTNLALFSQFATGLPELSALKLGASTQIIISQPYFLVANLTKAGITIPICLCSRWMVSLMPGLGTAPNSNRPQRSSCQFSKKEKVFQLVVYILVLFVTVLDLTLPWLETVLLHTSHMPSIFDI